MAANCASAAWLRLTSPHFEVLTDARERTARTALKRLELIHSVFAEAIGAKRPPLPVRVFLFGSDRDYRAFRLSRTSSAFFQSGAERDYIVLSDLGPETLRAAYHEYVHLVLHHSAAVLPRWLEEGTAEFYSTLDVRSGRLVLGLPVANHLRLLAAADWPVAAPETHDDDREKAALYYAQSWALVHMLNLAAPYRRQMPRFAELLDQTVPAPLAFEQAFSKPWEAALADLRSYLRAPQLPVVELLAADASAISIEVQALPQAAADLAQVELLIQLDRPEQAAKLLDRAAKLDPGSVEIETARGLLALSQKRNQTALGHFRGLIERQRAPAFVYLEYAMLLRESGAREDEYLPFLQQAVGRNPNLAEAHFLLGLAAQRQGRHSEAAASFQRAAQVLPRQSYFWHALSVSLHQAGAEDQARRAARKAAETASTKEQMDMAQAVLRLTTASAAPPAAPPRKPTVSTPESWKPRAGNTRIEGTLERIDCLGASARFHVRSGGRPVALWVDRPGEVLLRTGTGITFEFRCGLQRPRRVVIDYEAKLEPARKTEGVIAAIEFPQP